MVLQDPDVSPILSQVSSSAAEVEESSSGDSLCSDAHLSLGLGHNLELSPLPAADDNPTELLGREQPPVLPEEPESSEVEEEELPAGPLHTEVSDALPEPSMRLALPVPSPAEGLAEAWGTPLMALQTDLEDGEWCSMGLGGPPCAVSLPQSPSPPCPSGEPAAADPAAAPAQP